MTNATPSDSKSNYAPARPTQFGFHLERASCRKGPLASDLIPIYFGKSQYRRSWSACSGPISPSIKEMRWSRIFMYAASAHRARDIREYVMVDGGPTYSTASNCSSAGSERLPGTSPPWVSQSDAT